MRGDVMDAIASETHGPAICPAFAALLNRRKMHNCRTQKEDWQMRFSNPVNRPSATGDSVSSSDSITAHRLPGYNAAGTLAACTKPPLG
jgi:hypothetical protein